VKITLLKLSGKHHTLLWSNSPLTFHSQQYQKLKKNYTNELAVDPAADAAKTPTPRKRKGVSKTPVREGNDHEEDEEESPTKKQKFKTEAVQQDGI